MNPQALRSFCITLIITFAASLFLLDGGVTTFLLLLIGSTVLISHLLPHLRPKLNERLIGIINAFLVTFVVIVCHELLI